MAPPAPAGLGPGPGMQAMGGGGDDMMGGGGGRGGGGGGGRGRGRGRGGGGGEERQDFRGPPGLFKAGDWSCPSYVTRSVWFRLWVKEELRLTWLWTCMASTQNQVRERQLGAPREVQHVPDRQAQPRGRGTWQSERNEG